MKAAERARCMLAFPLGGWNNARCSSNYATRRTRGFRNCGAPIDHCKVFVVVKSRELADMTYLLLVMDLLKEVITRCGLRHVESVMAQVV